MLTTVTFTSFKAFRIAQIPLRRINLVIGPNGSGKSTLLEGLHYLSMLRTSPPQNLLGAEDIAAMRNRGGERNLGLAVMFEENGTKGGVSLKQLSGDSLASDQWKVIAQVDNDARVMRTIPDQRQWKYDSTEMEGSALQYLKASAFLQLDPAKLREPSWTDALEPIVNLDGGNLPTSLAELAGSDPDAFAEIQEALRSVIPTVDRIRTRRVKLSKEDFEHEGADMYRKVCRTVAGHELRFDFTGASDIRARDVSDGTLLTLGLLAVMMGHERPRLLLLDDFERGLHPRALKALVEQLRRLLDRFKDLQVVATTHSPYMVDLFDPSEIIVTALDDDGTAALGHLTKHPDFERWKDEMHPGEFWSSVGESWVVKGGRADRSTK